MPICQIRQRDLLEPRQRGPLRRLIERDVDFAGEHDHFSDDLDTEMTVVIAGHHAKVLIAHRHRQAPESMSQRICSSFSAERSTPPKTLCSASTIKIVCANWNVTGPMRSWSPRASAAVL